MILLGAEFISEASSIDHGALSFLFRILSGVKHAINLSLHGVQGSFQGTLGGKFLVVDGQHFVDRVASIGQIVVDLTGGPVGGIKKSSALLNLSRESRNFALTNSNLFSNLLTSASF